MRATLALAELSTLTQSVSDRLTAAGRTGAGEARRRLTLTLLGGLALLVMLMWTFWAKRGAADAARRERRFQALLRNSSDLVMVVEPGTLSVRYVTPVIARMLGYTPEAVLETNVLDLIHPDDRDGFEASLTVPADRDGEPTDRWRARHKDGTWIEVESIPLDLSDDRSVRGTVLTIRDVGERKTLEDRLRYQAFHDALTGLPNRSLFEDRVRHAVARVHRHGRGLSVLFVDLDDFKTVNDSLGHAAGDDLLRQVAVRLDSCIRSADTVARLGGDEFAVLVEELEEPEHADAVDARIHAALEKPFDVAEHEIFIHCSIGVALAAHGTTTEDLLRNADMAMYAAKGMGKGRSETFRPTMHMAAQKRLQLSGDLRRALRDNELSVQYQPLVNLADQRVLGVEALARWDHPDVGNIPPSDFIPIAEDTGLITQLGGWILSEACREARAWQLARPGEKAVYVSVNVSARQFRQAGMVIEQVSRALTDSGADPSMLVVEITESVLMQDRKAVSKELNDLHDARRAGRDRRFRHRLLRSELPARVSDRHRQDGPVLRKRPRGGSGRCRPRPLGGGTGRGAEHGDRGRGHRAPRPAGLPQRAAVRRGAGLLLRPAARQGRDRHAPERSDAALRRGQLSYRSTPTRSTSATRASRSVPAASAPFAARVSGSMPPLSTRRRLAATV